MAGSLLAIGACAQGVEVWPEPEAHTEHPDAGELADADLPEDAGVSEEDFSDASDDLDGGEDASDADVHDGGQDAAADASSEARELDASSSEAGADGSVADAAPAYSCPGCKLKVQWSTSTIATASQSIAGYLKLSNTGTAPIPLSGVSVRYWLRDAQAESLVVECYFWDGGGGANKCARADDAGINAYSQLNARVGTGTGNLRYVELTFPASAGDLLPGGASPGAMQLAFHLPSYATMDQSDDPSFDATLSGTGAGMLYDASKITAYLGGMLAWGTEP